MRYFLTQLKMSIRAYYRNPQAIVFGLVFPLIIMMIFGLLNLGAAPNLQVGVVNNANNPASAQFIQHLQQFSGITVHTGSRQEELDALNAGNRDLIAVLPSGLGEDRSAGPITAYLNDARPAQSQEAEAVLNQFAAQASFAAANITPAFAISVQKLPGKNQTYTDFLVPGVIGMTVMQTGIFSIAFVLVRLKQSGVLRRLLATPMKKSNFLIAEVGTRLLVSVIQIILLLLVAAKVLNFHLTGSAVAMVAVAALGASVFISVGFMISGIARNEDSVPAIANIVVLPMMFLSGVFFSVDSVPGWLRVVSDRLPLTYLTDGLRSLSVGGKTITQIGGDLLGLTIWLLIAAVAATRLFRWENR